MVKLNADHSGVCKFGTDQADQDNLKLARANIKDLYRAAVKTVELTVLPPAARKEPMGSDDQLAERFPQLQENCTCQFFFTMLASTLVNGILEDDGWIHTQRILGLR